MEFVCGAPHCKGTGKEEDRQIVWQYFDTKDITSTSNLHKHAKKYWGDDVVAKANEAKTNEN